MADQGTSNRKHHSARRVLPALEYALLPNHIATNYSDRKRTAIKRCAFLESGSTLYRNGMRRFFSPGVAAVGNALMKVLLARNCRIFFACLHSVTWRTVQKRVHPQSVTSTAGARKWQVKMGHGECSTRRKWRCSGGRGGVANVLLRTAASPSGALTCLALANKSVADMGPDFNMISKTCLEGGDAGATYF